METEELIDAMKRQWTMVLSLQMQTMSYPTTENLEKLKMAIDAYKTLCDIVKTLVGLSR